MLPFIADDALGTASDGMRKKFITGESPIYFQVAGEVGILKELDPDLDILLLPSAFTDKPEDQTIISGFDSGIRAKRIMGSISPSASALLTGGNRTAGFNTFCG